MPRVTIYTKDYCPYCQAALKLLAGKKADVERIEVTSPAMQADMAARANGRRTVPQIFIGSQHIGGCDDLYALDESGRLDPLLAG
jgi:glutaredoxin 3